MQNYDTYPYYARPSPSIMPGQTWRDNGHKGLMPVITNSKNPEIPRLMARQACTENLPIDAPTRAPAVITS